MSPTILSLVLPGTTYGLSHFLKGDREHLRQVVCESSAGLVYTLFAKDVAAHLSHKDAGQGFNQLWIKNYYVLSNLVSQYTVVFKVVALSISSTSFCGHGAMLVIVQPFSGTIASDCHSCGRGGLFQAEMYGSEPAKQKIGGQRCEARLWVAIARSGTVDPSCFFVTPRGLDPFSTFKKMKCNIMKYQAKTYFGPLECHETVKRLEGQNELYVFRFGRLKRLC